MSYTPTIELVITQLQTWAERNGYGHQEVDGLYSIDIDLGSRDLVVTIDRQDPRNLMEVELYADGGHTGPIGRTFKLLELRFKYPDGDVWIMQTRAALAAIDQIIRVGTHNEEVSA